MQRDNYIKLLGCVCLWALGVFAIFYGLAGHFFLSLVGLGLTLLSLRIGLPIIRRVYNEESKLFYILRHQPRRIVWIYGVVTEHLPFGLSILRTGIIYVKLIDSEEITVSVKPEKMTLVLHTLRRLLPHATFGYSPDIARRYELEPEYLLRDSKQDR